MMGDCNTCKHYEGDCGHHFVDSNKHINFDCPDEACCDKCGNCLFFERKKQKRSPRIPIDRIKQVAEQMRELGVTDGIEYVELIDGLLKEYEGGE